MKRTRSRPSARLTEPLGVLVAAATLLGLILSTSVAQAGPSPEEVEQFKKLVRQAGQQYKEGNYVRALERYRSAKALVDVPEMTYRIGRSLEKIGHCEKAHSTYVDFLAREDLKSAHRQKGKKRLKVMGDQCVPKGKLTVECRPTDQTVEVSVGDQTETCPANFRLESGDHVVTARAEEFEQQQTDVAIAEAETTETRITLSPVGVEPPTVTDSGGGAGWVPYAKWGSLGLGVGLLGAGIVDDYASAQRFETRLAEAQTDGDETARTRAVDAYESARGRIVALYVTGAVLTAAGTTLMIVNPGANPDRRQGVSVKVGAAPGSVFTRIRW